ncbi:MAG: DUF1289 domain-containing protein [Rhodanobacteraceae bacterium]
MDAPAKPVLPLTPCVGICRLDERGFCIGCRRNLDEIAHWGLMSDAERLRCMLEVLPKRDRIALRPG